MFSDVQFQSVGYFKGHEVTQPAVFIVDSQQKLQKLWNTVNAPTIDFTTKKILVIKEQLSSISCNLFVHKIQMVAKETLHIEWSKMSDGSACAAVMGMAHQFLVIDRTLQFTNVKITQWKEPPKRRTYEDHWTPQIPSLIESLDKIPL